MQDDIAVPPRQYEFAGHAEHTLFVEAVQVVISYVLGTHVAVHVVLRVEAERQ